MGEYLSAFVGEKLWNWGLGAVMALLLLGLLTGIIPSRLLALAEDTSNILHTHATQGDDMTRLLRQICINGGRDDNARDKCY